jgi:hypothetical protein
MRSFCGLLLVTYWRLGSEKDSNIDDLGGDWATLVTSKDLGLTSFGGEQGTSIGGLSGEQGSSFEDPGGEQDVASTTLSDEQGSIIVDLGDEQGSNIDGP